ncbi:MAG TPA: glycosyltransferase family 39 protein [Armatimonadota bacterium]|nr:glycosyltransferase family 39 protein [Armatimonadota bacterium]
MTKRSRIKQTGDKRTTDPGVKYLAAILVVHVVLALVYWRCTPFGASPDERPHGKYVQALVESRSLPVFSTSDPEGYEYHQPPLYYLMGVPFYLAGRLSGLANPAEMVRLLSLLLGGLSILIAYAAVRAALPEEKGLPLAVAGFVALLPTHVMLSSSVSNDPLAEVVFGLALLVIAGMLVDGPKWRRTVGLGLVLGIGLLTKTTCVLLFPVALLAYLLAWQRGTLAAKSVAGHLGAAVGVSLIIGAWWLVRNQAIFGDPFAMSQFQRAFQHTATLESLLSKGWSWGVYSALVGAWTFASFWGVFGHMKVFMPTWTYCALAAISIAAGIGSLRSTVRIRATSVASRDVLLVYGVTIALVLLAFIRFNLTFFQAQGRYLYPALIPISVLWALGISELLPAQWRRFMPHLVVGITLIVQIVALATCIIPVMPHAV